MFITMVGVFFLRVPLAYYFGMVCAGGLMGAWIGMGSDMIWRAMAAAYRFSRAHWITTRV
jgi:Na+-driven multidrug efflux pump